MKISQLKRKIESEYEEQYRREDGDLAIGIIEDISGKPLRDVYLVGDHLKQDDKIFVYPKPIDKASIQEIPYIIDPKDLITTIRQAHYSTVAQLSATALDEHPNKTGIIHGIIGLGFSNDKVVVQNLGIVLLKVITERNVNAIHDNENNFNILDLTVLVIDSWI
jgi:hypothetical protein